MAQYLKKIINLKSFSSSCLVTQWGLQDLLSLYFFWEWHFLHPFLVRRIQRKLVSVENLLIPPSSSVLAWYR